MTGKPLSIRTFAVNTHSDHFRISAEAKLIGDDLVACIWGGERPHVGAVAMAQSRPSLADPTVMRATASVHAFHGHKEDEIVKFAAEELAAALETNVVVTAGIHWDDLDRDSIELIVERSHEIVDQLKTALTQEEKATP